ncbi:MAG TPA: hypothetical protein VMV93_01355, partial [Chloroflexota bacterium]|nr:hypothetical protein [Chloroflexota bacterium]
ALARNPAERYDRADEMADDLRASRPPVGRRPAGQAAYSEGAPLVSRRPVQREAALGDAHAAEAHGRTVASISKARRRNVAWLLPVVIVLAAVAGIAYAALRAPGQGAGPAPGASATAATGPASPAGVNLLTNGALVTNGAQPAGWRLDVFAGRPPYRFWQPGGPAGTAKDREIGINSSTGTDAAWTGNDVPAKAGQKLTLTGFVKTQAVAGDGPGAALHLVCHAPGGAVTGQAAGPAVKGSTDWRQEQAALTVPAGSSACLPQLRLGDTGHPTTGTAEFSRLALVAG